MKEATKQAELIGGSYWLTCSWSEVQFQFCIRCFSTT